MNHLAVSKIYETVSEIW